MPELRIAPVMAISVVVLALACPAGEAAQPAAHGVAVRSLRGSLMISSVSGHGKRPLTQPLGRHERRWDYGPAWSPDGSMVAFARWTPKQLSLMVVRSDGNGLRRLAALGSWPKSRYTAGVYDIHWSPDGSRLAYLAVFPSRTGSPERIYVTAVDGSGPRPLALIPSNTVAFFSLFGWTPDGSRVTYAYSLGGSRPEDYEGPSDLMTTLANGTDTAKLLTEDEIDQASWLADGSVVYVRHCLSACQLALRERGSVTSRPLTHFKAVGDVLVASPSDYLPVMQRPSGDVVYTHGSKVYDFSPTTNTTRRVHAFRFPRRKDCVGVALTDAVLLAGISPDGRVALIEFTRYCQETGFSRAYRLDLETGALTRIRLITTNPAQIYLP